MQDPKKVRHTASQTWQLFKDVGLKALPIIQLRESLLKDSKLTLNYLVLIVSSCLIASFGLLLNSAAVIIGAMIIAPLMMPLRGFSFATLEGDLKLLWRSSISIFFGTMLGIACSWIVGTIISIPEFKEQVLSRTQPNLIDLLIALVAGGVSGYAKIRPEIGDAVPGTAIAVALMPPLCVVGLTLSQAEWGYSQGAFLLYITNLIGINLACLLVYVFSGYARSNEVTRTLSWGVSIGLIGLLALPLGFSFVELIQQAQANDSIRNILVENSQFSRSDIELIRSDIDWNYHPPSITVVVRSVEPITPQDVTLLEDLIKTKMGRTFKVVFDVTASTKVESQTESQKSNN